MMLAFEVIFWAVNGVMVVGAVWTIWHNLGP